MRAACRCSTRRANANAVKELVIAGMLIAARNLVPARFVSGLEGNDEALNRQVEDGRNTLPASSCLSTLGVINR
jgi:D-3-phosphoglycerate dehydrogenase